ncbi:hypothetical protein Dimus_008473 [Dionaea muscipula]
MAQHKIRRVIRELKEEMKEKRRIVEEHLPKQLDFAKREAVREFLSSEEWNAKFNGASVSVLWNGFKIGIAEVRELLMDDEELIPKLEKIEMNLNIKYEKELIPTIEGEPSISSEVYEADPMKFIKEWEIDANVSINAPRPMAVRPPVPPIAASQAPSTSTTNVPSQDPAANPPPMSEQNIPPPSTDGGVLQMGIRRSEEGSNHHGATVLLQDTPPSTSEGYPKRASPIISTGREENRLELERVSSESVSETGANPNQTLSPIMQDDA